MKKNIYNIVALLFLVALSTSCVDEYPIITDPDGAPIPSPGMACIIKDGLPEDIGINITDAAGAHQYTAVPGVAFNTEAGLYQAVAYTPASGLVETLASIINLPVTSDGKVSQPEFSACVTPFTVTEDYRVDVALNPFQPMTRQLVIPFSFPEVEMSQINSVTLRIKNAVNTVDVSKGFGHPVSSDASYYVEAEALYSVPAQLSGLADGILVFRLPAAPVAVNGFLDAQLLVDIKDFGAYHALPGIVDLEGAFNAGPAMQPYFTGIVGMYLTPGGIETEIKDWEKGEGVEIPGA